MKQLTPDLYVIEPGIYAERRGEQWFVSNEDSAVLAGPFDTVEAARDHQEDRAGERVEAELDALDPDAVVVLKPGDPGFVEFDPRDLMTLRQAAKHLPVSSQALYAARARGALPEPRRVIATPATKSGQVSLYSLADLAAIYEAKTVAERISEGARRGWAKLTPEERAARVARIQEGQKR